MFIYLIVNHKTGKYYVGQHKGTSLKKYLRQKFYHAQKEISKGSHLYNSMRKHPDPSVWSIHALRADIQTREELDQIEKDFIKFLRSQDPEYGYNICRGGEGIDPDIKSKQTKNLWTKPDYRSKQVKNRKERWTSEYRAWFSQRIKGCRLMIDALIQRNRAPISSERRQKLREAHIGIRRSERSRIKQGFSISGDKHWLYGKHHSDLCYFKNCEKHGKVKIVGPQATCPKCRFEMIERILEMQKQGIPPDEVAKKLNVSRRKISRWIRETKDFSVVI